MASSSSPTLVVSRSSKTTSPETLRADDLKPAVETRVGRMGIGSDVVVVEDEDIGHLRDVKRALKEHLLKVFSLSRTNALMRRGIDTDLEETTKTTMTVMGSKRSKKTSSSTSSQRWLSSVSDALSKAQVTVVPKPADTNQSVSIDPRRGVYITKRDFGGPNSHLCKLIRRRLLNKIVRRQIDNEANRSKSLFKSRKAPTPTSASSRRRRRRRRLDRWRLARARRLESRARAQRRRRRRDRRPSKTSVATLSRMRRKISKAKMLLVRCSTCRALHVRHTPCPVVVRDLRMRNFVHQIEREAVEIDASLQSAWHMLEGLEFAYHEILFKVHRIQADKVCLKLLTGTDFPGDSHPDHCPCDEDAFNLRETLEEHDRLAAMAEMEREEERRRIRRAREEERRRRERTNARRERLIELRKRRFYRELHEQLNEQQGSVVEPTSHFSVEPGASASSSASSSAPRWPLSSKMATSLPEPNLSLTTLESASFALMRRQRTQTLDDDLELRTTTQGRGPSSLLTYKDNRLSGLARLLNSIRERKKEDEMDCEEKNMEKQGGKEEKKPELVEEGGKLEEQDPRVV